MEALIQLGVFVVLLCLGYFVGTFLERKHYTSIIAREQATLSVLSVPLKSLPGMEDCRGSELVMGSVVVSIDYFKRIVANLRNIFGGRIGAYESVLDRGRREAVLRMKEDAIKRGYDAVLCVRLETSRLASSMQQGKGTAGIEILAYGTAIKLPADSPFRPRAG